MKLRMGYKQTGMTLTISAQKPIRPKIKRRNATRGFWDECKGCKKIIEKYVNKWGEPYYDVCTSCAEESYNVSIDSIKKLLGIYEEGLENLKKNKQLYLKQDEDARAINLARKL